MGGNNCMSLMWATSSPVDGGNNSLAPRGAAANGASECRCRSVRVWALSHVSQHWRLPAPSRSTSGPILQKTTCAGLASRVTLGPALLVTAALH